MRTRSWLGSVCVTLVFVLAACTSGQDPASDPGGGAGSGAAGAAGAAGGGSGGPGGGAGGAPGGCLDAATLDWVLPATNAHAEGREQLVGVKGGRIAFLDTTGELRMMPAAGGEPTATGVKAAQAVLLDDRVIAIEAGGASGDGASFTVKAVPLAGATASTLGQITLPLGELPRALLPDGASVLLASVAGGLGSDASVRIYRVDLASPAATALASLTTTLAPFNFVRVGGAVFLEEPKNGGNVVHFAPLDGGAPGVLPVAGQPSLAGASPTELLALSATESGGGHDVKLQRFSGGVAPATDVALGGGAKFHIVEHPVFGPAPGGTAFYVSGAGQVHTLQAGAGETRKAACFGSNVQALSLYGDDSSLYAMLLIGSDSYGIARLPAP